MWRALRAACGVQIGNPAVQSAACAPAVPACGATVFVVKLLRERMIASEHRRATSH
jgi:hypothetical protein